MLKRPVKWWQRIELFWDRLCGLCEQARASLHRLCACTVVCGGNSRLRLPLRLEELEPRWVPNSAPVAVADSYSTHVRRVNDAV